MVSAKSAIEMVQDKLQTAQLFAAVGLPDRKPWRSLHGRLNRCLIRSAFPRAETTIWFERQGTFVCSTPSAVERALRRSKVYIAQQLVDRNEVTTDVFGDAPAMFYRSYRGSD